MKSDRNASTANLHHNLILEDRANMNLSGVTDVECFDERTIRLYTQLGELVIKGRNLHIDSVSVETGDMRRKDSWRTTELPTYFGEGLVRLQSTMQTGKAKVIFHVEGFDKPFVKEGEVRE